jgi:hypothetical protein
MTRTYYWLLNIVMSHKMDSKILIMIRSAQDSDNYLRKYNGKFTSVEGRDLDRRLRVIGFTCKDI